MKFLQTRSFYHRLAMAAAFLGGAAGAGAALAQEPQLPTEWKNWEGGYYRLEADGNLSCYRDSSDATECSVSVPVNTKIKPLSCGRLEWKDGQQKVTGYQVTGWCNDAYANLFAQWEDYEALGQRVILATNPRGDVICMSADATTCTHSRLHPKFRPRNNIKPVVCGRLMQRTAGFTGYENPSHWCSTPEIVGEWERDPTSSHRVSLAGKMSDGYQFNDLELPQGESSAFIMKAEVPRWGSPWQARVSLGLGGTENPSHLETNPMTAAELGQNDGGGYAASYFSIRRAADGTYSFHHTLSPPTDIFQRPIDSGPNDILLKVKQGNPKDDSDFAKDRPMRLLFECQKGAKCTDQFSLEEFIQVNPRHPPPL